MVLAQKQTQRSMEQNREPRNKPMHIWSINFNRDLKMYSGEKTFSSINGDGKTGQPHAKE